MKITRRQFVSWGLAAGAAIGVEGIGHAFFGHVMRTASRMDVPVPTVCRACPAGCGIVGYLRNNKRLVAIMGNPEHPASRGKLCALAMASINLHHHPERLFKARTKNGQTMAASKAIEQAGGKIAELVERGARVVIDTWDEQSAHGEFLAALGEAGKLIGREALEGHNRFRVMDAVWGSEVRPDFETTDLLLAFGADPFSGGPRFIQDARRMVEAKAERGARMIVIDPRLSNTAGRADIWLPVRPGTDHVAALAIVRQALERMDLAKTLRLKGGGASLVRLAQAIDRFDPETAGDICGIKPDLLIRAGELYAQAKAPATMTGDGVFDRQNALELYRAISLLDALRGPHQVPLPPRPRFVPSDEQLNSAEAEGLYIDVERSRAESLILVSHRTNPMYERGPRFARALRKGHVVYHVAISPFPNETTKMADLVIPEALPIESGGRVWLNSYVAGPTYVQQQPIVPPPEGVLTSEQIFHLLAQAVGGEVKFENDYDLKQIRSWTGARNFFEIGEGIFTGDVTFPRTVQYNVSFSNLEKSAAMDVAEEDPQRFSLVLHGSSVNNRSSAYAKWLAEIEHDDPLFLHPDDARRLRVRDGDKVSLSASLPADSASGREMQFEVTAAVFVSNGVRPGVVALVRGKGRKHGGKLAAARRFETEMDPDMGMVWWESEGNGVNLAPLETKEIDPETESVVVPAPRVTVKKV